MKKEPRTTAYFITRFGCLNRINLSDFPKGGDIETTRAWLDKEGFCETLIGWKADAIIGLKDEYVLEMLPGTDFAGF